MELIYMLIYTLVVYGLGVYTGKLSIKKDSKIIKTPFEEL